MSTDPLRQYRHNEATYTQIADMLSEVNDIFLSADRFRQKLMLFDSATFAVMSVQNSVEILKRGFRSYVDADNWDDVRDTFKHVNYGNNKFDYTRRNFELIFHESVGDEIIDTLERGDTDDAVEIIVENLNGVSWIKGAFVPAMLGFTDVMCIDTNVAQMVPEDSVVAKGYKSQSEYSDAVDRVKQEFPDLSDEVSTFMLQWIVFDANREDGVAIHDEWFEVMLPGSPFGQQATLGEY